MLNSLNQHSSRSHYMSTSRMHRRPFEGRYLVIRLFAFCLCCSANCITRLFPLYYNCIAGCLLSLGMLAYWHFRLISRGETSVEQLINKKERSRLASQGQVSGRISISGVGMICFSINYVIRTLVVHS